MRDGKGCGHLDVAARVVLKEKGPFIFLGTRPVAARMPADFDTQGYDLLRFGFIYVNQLYRDLVDEGCLDTEYVKAREKKLLRTLIPKYVLNQVAIGNRGRIYQQQHLLKTEFGKYWEYYFFVRPIFFLPRTLISIPYKILRWFLNITRDILNN